MSGAPQVMASAGCGHVPLYRQHQRPGALLPSAALRPESLWALLQPSAAPAPGDTAGTLPTGGGLLLVLLPCQVANAPLVKAVCALMLLHVQVQAATVAQWKGCLPYGIAACLSVCWLAASYGSSNCHVMLLVCVSSMLLYQHTICGCCRHGILHSCMWSASL
jgi:hypothetical protein